MRDGPSRFGRRLDRVAEFAGLGLFSDLGQDLVAEDILIAGLADRPARAAKLILEQAPGMRLEMRREEP
jgi:hypothetical protein